MIVIQNRRKDASFDVPIGGLILWYGLAAAVPPGWEIYSETQGHFIAGAPAGGMTLTPAGGSHAHTIPNTDSTGIHSHPVSGAGVSGGPSTQIYNAGSQNVAPGGHGHSASGVVNADTSNHAHTIPDASQAVALPAYHRLYWIKAVL